MKKLAFFLLASIAVASIMVSCSSSTDCPAYASVQSSEVAVG